MGPSSLLLNFIFARFTESDWLKNLKRLSEKIKIWRNRYFSARIDESGEGVGPPRQIYFISPDFARFIFIERASNFELIVFIR